MTDDPTSPRGGYAVPFTLDMTPLAPIVFYPAGTLPVRNWVAYWTTDPRGDK